MRTMPRTDAQPTPAPRRRKRRWVALAGATGLLALVVLTFNVWVTSAVNGALSTTSLEATLDQVHVNLGQGRFSIVGLSWQSAEGETRVFLIP